MPWTSVGCRVQDVEGINASSRKTGDLIATDSERSMIRDPETIVAKMGALGCVT